MSLYWCERCKRMTDSKTCCACGRPDEVRLARVDDGLATEGTDTLQRIEDWLIESGFMEAGGIQDRQQPTHGSCCTCQTCGRGYDDCVCDSNRHWQEWNGIKAQVADRGHR